MSEKSPKNLEVFKNLLRFFRYVWKKSEKPFEVFLEMSVKSLKNLLRFF